MISEFDKSLFNIGYICKVSKSNDNKYYQLEDQIRKYCEEIESIQQAFGYKSNSNKDSIIPLRFVTFQIPSMAINSFRVNEIEYGLNFFSEYFSKNKHYKDRKNWY